MWAQLRGAGAPGISHSGKLLLTPVNSHPKGAQGEKSVSEADLELEPEKRAADRTCGYKGVQNRTADTGTDKPACRSPDLASSQYLHRPTQQEASRQESPGDVVCGDQPPVSPIQSAEKRGRKSKRSKRKITSPERELRLMVSLFILLEW